MKEREKREIEIVFRSLVFHERQEKEVKKRLNINKEFPVTKYSRLGGIYHNQSSDIDP